VWTSGSVAKLNAHRVTADAVRFVPNTAEDVLYVHTDHLGSPQKMTDVAGAVVWDAAFTPFGQAAAISGAAVNNLRFPGQYFDAETGLHDNWMRDYDPGLGRYIQSDPIGLAGGLNTYAYVGGNPLNRIDPFGLAEYPDKFVGPLPPDGYYTSEMTQTRCGRIPPAPPGADIVKNMKLADDSWDPIWFYNQVRNSGPWDYKQQGRKYEDFGNYNFGATGTAFGLPSAVLLRGAGWANKKADPTRKGLGDPWGKYPYGDDPNDQVQIQSGINYCTCIGY